METPDPSSSTASTEAIAQLRAELSEVQRQLAELRQFIQIGTREDGSKFLGKVTCSFLDICNPEKEGDTRVWIAATHDEASIGLWGNDHRPRVLIVVDEHNRGSATVLGSGNNVAVNLWADSGDHGQICVYSPAGKPRAGMKSLPDAGVVSVVAEDGSVRALLRSTEEAGEVAVAHAGGIAARMKTGEHGGIVACLGTHASKAGAVLTTNAAGDGLLLMNNGDGHNCGVFGCGDGTAMLTVGQSFRKDGSEASAVRLIAHATGSALGLHNDAGHEVIRMITTEDGACLSVNSKAADDSLVALHAAGSGGLVSVKHPGHHASSLLGTNDDGGYLSLVSEDAMRGTMLHFSQGGGSLTFFSDFAQRIGALTLGYDQEHHSALHLFGPAGAENTAVTLFTHEHGGSVLVHGIDGTRQAGLTASEDGGSAVVFSDLGVERVTLRSLEDGGGLALKWGGTNGLIACATESGGLLTVLDPAGDIRATFPSGEFDNPKFEDSP